MEKSYLNVDEGFACCIWSAPSREALAALFEKAGVPHERIVAVKEMTD